MLFLAFLGPFAHPQIDPKRYLGRKWAECMVQGLSLKIRPYQIIRPIALGEMIQNNQNKVVMLVLAIVAPPNGHKRVCKGPQMSLMYGPLSKLEIKPHTKSLGPFF
jgi:hypothetical protein